MKAEKTRDLKLNDRRHGIKLDVKTWEAIDWLAARAGVKWPELVQSWVTDDPESVKVNLTGAIRASLLADLMEATIVAPRLDEDSLELLKRLETFTGMSPAQTVGKLFPAHLEELWQYLEWLEQLPERPSKARNLGRYLLQNYGPASLAADIKRLDPTFQAESEKVASIKSGEA